MSDVEPFEVELSVEEKAALIIARQVASEYRKRNRILLGVICALGLALALVAGGAVLYAKDSNDKLEKASTRGKSILAISKDTKEVVETLRSVTGDAAVKQQQEAQTKVINELVSRLDCSTRQALQDALNQIADQSGLDPVNVLCKAPPG